MDARRASTGWRLRRSLYRRFLYGPVLLLPLFSFNDSIYVAFPAEGLHHRTGIAQMAENPALHARRCGTASRSADRVAVISTMLGLLAAKALTRYRLPGRGARHRLRSCCRWSFPSIILGIALLVLLRKRARVELSL